MFKCLLKDTMKNSAHQSIFSNSNVFHIGDFISEFLVPFEKYIRTEQDFIKYLLNHGQGEREDINSWSTRCSNIFQFTSINDNDIIKCVFLSAINNVWKEKYAKTYKVMKSGQIKWKNIIVKEDKDEKIKELQNQLNKLKE